MSAVFACEVHLSGQGSAADLSAGLCTCCGLWTYTLCTPLMEEHDHVHPQCDPRRLTRLLSKHSRREGGRKGRGWGLGDIQLPGREHRGYFWITFAGHPGHPRRSWTPPSAPPRVGRRRRHRHSLLLQLIPCPHWRVGPRSCRGTAASPRGRGSDALRCSAVWRGDKLTSRFIRFKLRGSF